MTSRSTAMIAAGVLAVGLVTGAAGAIVIGDATADRAMGRHFDQMGSMRGMTAGTDMGATMEMMGGSMMNAPGQMGPGSSQHDVHHPNANR